MDTTRVDALSAYQTFVGPTRWETRTTPRLEALAADGVRFARFYANAPTTLNSHTTMFTGMDPHEHGVVRNGYPFIEPGQTIASALTREGYDTIAVLGAAALEQAMGLSRGFRVYDDRMPDLKSVMYQDVAEGVVRRTFQHVDRRDGDAPLFLFVHFYDAHAPYNAPLRFRERFSDPAYRGPLTTRAPLPSHVKTLRKDEADPVDTAQTGAMYLAEVAYIDEQIGVLLDGLAERGLLDEALVVVTADHGETLADDPTYAYSHGSNVEEDVMHVPLILKGYGVDLPSGMVVASQAAMPGLAPTLQRALGFERTLGEHPDFWDLLRPGPVWDEDGWPERPTQVAFVEASRPRKAETTEGWNNLPLHRGVFAGGYGYWTAPWLKRRPTEWYDVPDIGDDAIFGELTHMVEQWDARAPAYRPVHVAPATYAALRALGYVD
jgi:arylsulfatase A-like enzyme